MEWISWNSDKARIWAGNCLRAYPDDYIVVDIETTGLNPEKDEIIEIAAVRYSDNRKVDSFNCLVKPSRPVTEEIIALTGIDNVMLEHAMDTKTALLNFYNFVTEDRDQAKLHDFCKMDNPILMAYNAPFDIGFLYDKLLKYHNLYLNNDFVDVLLLAREQTPQLEHHRQIDMANLFHISTKGAHRAENDTRVCNAVYQKLKEMKFKGYREPLQCKELEVNESVIANKPLAGRNFYVSGYMQHSTKFNLLNLIYGLGGNIDRHFEDHTDCIVLGLGEKSILESEEIKYATNIKNNLGRLKIFREETFIKGLLKKNYACVI